mmetsp:Transcript_1169/g.2454  ORF Transcript_1169/g.2454 Transcript_1169/m.2454 type:complete len:98 (+) Transcript_1169:226-519(+)
MGIERVHDVVESEEHSMVDGGVHNEESRGVARPARGRGIRRVRRGTHGVDRRLAELREQRKRLEYENEALAVVSEAFDLVLREVLVYFESKNAKQAA